MRLVNPNKIDNHKASFRYANGITELSRDTWNFNGTRSVAVRPCCRYSIQSIAARPPFSLDFDIKTGDNLELDVLSRPIITDFLHIKPEAANAAVNSDISFKHKRKSGKACRFGL